MRKVICKTGEAKAVEIKFRCILLLSIFLKNVKAMFFISLDQCTTADNLDKNLTRFWDLEMLGMSENEQHFHETLLKGFI